MTDTTSDPYAELQRDVEAALRSSAILPSLLEGEERKLELSASHSFVASFKYAMRSARS